MKLSEKPLRPWLIALTLLSTTAAQAHMPYVLPTQFDVGKAGHVTVQSAFAEDAFMPELAMRDAPFHLIKPDGAKGDVGPVTYLRDMSIFEADLKSEGTYRLTSGQRLGRMNKMYQQGGQWVTRSENGTVPAGATVVDVQSATLADAYVTRGAATNAVLKPRGQALEIQAVTHPNAITSGDAANFILLFDGKPLINADVSLFRSAGIYDGRKNAGQVKSDITGRFSFTPNDAGTYLILVRHRAPSPTGAATPYRSYTYTLAFDAA